MRRAFGDNDCWKLYETDEQDGLGQASLISCLNQDYCYVHCGKREWRTYISSHQNNSIEGSEWCQIPFQRKSPRVPSPSTETMASSQLTTRSLYPNGCLRSFSVYLSAAKIIVSRKHKQVLPWSFSPCA